jgi:predicted SnoaL-like aldol condensation-catalyzing enzyme
MDIVRLHDGKIIEHWDVVQEVSEKAPNANTRTTSRRRTRDE